MIETFKSSWEKKQEKKLNKKRKKEKGRERVGELKILLDEVDAELVGLEQQKDFKKDNRKLTPKEKKMIKVLDKVWLRRDKVHAMYLRGLSAGSIAKHTDASRAQVWKDIAAKKWELQRMKSANTLEEIKLKLEELLRLEWRRYRSKHIEESERLKHATIIQDLLKDLARMEGQDFKDAPKNQFNIFGRNQQINVLEKPVEEMTDAELDDSVRKEEKILNEIKTG